MVARSTTVPRPPGWLTARQPYLRGPAAGAGPGAADKPAASHRQDPRDSLGRDHNGTPAAAERTVRGGAAPDGPETGLRSSVGAPPTGTYQSGRLSRSSRDFHAERLLGERFA
ncbi:hypothetical protein GCM10009802_48890 [Streptomyces synnematoformans]|uniref:Uncharacterized protein n=1 Tax=Streptomyces synnematoformans TaxID=415721 RepID=A0ABN2Z9S9_9ACTN